MTEQDDVAVLFNSRDNITYFLHIREERREFVFINRDELEKAKHIQNCIIVVIVPNDKNDSTKGFSYYGLSANRWFECCEVHKDKCIVPINRLKNLEGFNL